MKIFKKISRHYKTLKLAYIACESLINLPEIKNVDSCYKKFSSRSMSRSNSSSLDIGCGLLPRNPFDADHTYGIDIRENEAKGIRYADLNVEKIPFEDDKFDYITAYDFLEHVPRLIYAPNRRFPFIELMNEIYRTLKPGGIFFSFTPMYPFPDTVVDPTHVNQITNTTFDNYFDDVFRWASDYGFKGKFSIAYQARSGQHLVSILEKK
jgi:SAM-dependent methyltransferase